MKEYTVIAIVGEIRSVKIEAESQLAAEETILSDPRVLIVIDTSDWDEFGITHEEIDTVLPGLDDENDKEDPKDPVPKVH